MTIIEELIMKYIKGADRVINEIKEIPEKVNLKNEEAETYPPILSNFPTALMSAFS